MLLEFRTKNFKTFRDECVFSLKPTTQKDLGYSILKEKVGNRVFRGLCSTVVYGPNASGKTNLIEAIDVLKSIILRGNVKNQEEIAFQNPSRSRLELIPNQKESNTTPVCFSITFTEDKMLFEYKLEALLGGFLDVDFERKIIKETLTINGATLFNRGDDLVVENLKSIRKYIKSHSEENLTSAIQFAKNSLNDYELFLTNGFKSIFSNDLVEVITNWFSEKFIIICKSDSAEVLPQNAKAGKIYANKEISGAAKIFGAQSKDLVYLTGENGEATLFSVLKDKGDDKKAPAIRSDFYESYGTIRFVRQFPLIIDAIKQGGTLVMDEFDASIHPMALMNIVKIFHNDELNINNAQLIFNTHNPIFLDGDLFRRDEIKFVERNEDTNDSDLYALSDFGTAGKCGVRNCESYLKHYFHGRYGAIREIDFSAIFEDLAKEDRK